MTHPPAPGGPPATPPPPSFDFPALSTPGTPQFNAAWARVVSHHRSELRTVLAKFGAQPTDVDDLLQHVWITAMDEIHTLRNRSADGFRSWLRGIARNTAAAHYRDSATRRRAEEHAAAEAPLVSLQRPDTGDGQRLLALLQPRERTLVRMLAEGYSREEVSRRLGVGVAAVHQIVLRIRKMLDTKGWR